jgi:hypothetical protein
LFFAANIATPEEQGIFLLPINPMPWRVFVTGTSKGQLYSFHRIAAHKAQQKPVLLVSKSKLRQLSNPISQGENFVET